MGGVSRAVRTPSRLEQSVTSLAVVTPPQPPSTPSVALFFAGNEQFESEQVISYELGYRTTMINNVSVDLTAFYNVYDNLRSVKFNSSEFNPTTGTVDFVYSFTNNAKAKIYGIEIATVWQMLDWWRWDANYSLLKTDLKVLPGEEGSSTSPQQRVSLRSIISVRPEIDLDLLFRYVDSNQSVGFFGATETKDYISMDIRLAWRPVSDIELSVTGQNLLDPQHREYRQEAFTLPTEIERGVYGKMTWRF